MKILAILFRVPFPLKDGGAIALYNLVKGLSEQGHELTILSYNTTKHYVNPLPQEITSLGKVITVDIDNRIKPIKALLNLFGSQSYHVERFITDEFSKTLQEILEKETFDVIHFDGLFTSMYLETAKKYASKTPCALRQHNVEHQIWERVAEGAKGLKKWYLTILASRLKKYEQSVLPQFDTIVPITAIDAQSFKKMGVKKQYVLPVGVDTNRFESKLNPDRKSVFHLGSLDWMPNQEGVKWFVELVWPLVLKEEPEASFYIAGRDIPDWIKAYHGKNKVYIAGEVESASDFMNSKEIMIVPLKSGSGMRVKIIEGFAARKAIVSTAVGAEGINYEKGTHIEIADSEKEFASKILILLNNEPKIKELGEQAFELVKKEYSNAATVKGLVGYYSELISE